MNKIRTLYHQYWFLFPQLVALLIPFGVNSGLVFFIWLLSFLFFSNPKDILYRFSFLVKNKWFYVMITFFMIHVLGVFYSVNKHEAGTAIEIKLSFLAFPLLFFSHKFNANNLLKVITTFVSSCFLVCVFCLFRAFYLHFFEDIDAFYYSSFSFFLHPSYFSMYLLTSLSIVLLYYKSWLPHLKNLLTKIILISTIFIICIFLSASKIGLLTFFILIPILGCIWLYRNGYVKWIFISLFALFILLFLVFKFVPGPMERVKVALSVTQSNHEIDKTATESTAVRMLIWEQAVQIIKQNPIIGTSPGDANDALYDAYAKNGMTGAYDKKLNAHNQFFQTFIGTGFIGFSVLLIITLGVIFYGIIKKNYFLSIFGFIITLNFLVESMLQTQAGVIFYTFMLCIILQYNFSLLKPEPFTNKTNSN
jgi:O-antigen ligase